MRTLTPLIATVLLLVPGCSGDDADTWIYWLADPDPDAIASADGIAVVTDYSLDGSDEGALSADQVASMSLDGERPVLAYLSIGEAESYRYYWDPAWDADGDGNPDAGAPVWLGPENPQWEGNYKVRYWEADWHELLLGSGGYLERILEAGFDGVYLDIIDAYYYWAEEAPAADQRPVADTAADMIDLLDLIARMGRADVRAFALFPQNGEFVGYDAGDHGMDELLGIIDGFGVEDVFHPGDADEDNPWEPDDDRLEVLDEVIAADGQILTVEYLTDPGAIETFHEEAAGHGFASCAARRDLASLPR